jgi:hypothetical protein
MPTTPSRGAAGALPPAGAPGATPPAAAGSDDGALPASIVSRIGSAAAQEPPVEPDAPRRGPGRPRGSRNKPKDGAAAEPQSAAAPPPPPPVTAAQCAAVARMVFAGCGNFAATWAAQRIHKQGATVAESVAFGKSIVNGWTLNDEEAETIGKATCDYLAFLNMNVTPGWALVVAVSIPLIGRGVQTYAAVVQRQDGASGDKRPDGDGKKPPTQSEHSA